MPRGSTAGCRCSDPHEQSAGGRFVGGRHVRPIVAADFFVVPTATCRVLFVLVILAHERQRVVHVAVTPHPRASWTAEQFREAFPWNQALVERARLRGDRCASARTCRALPCSLSNCRARLKRERELEHDVHVYEAYLSVAERVEARDVESCPPSRQLVARLD